MYSEIHSTFYRWICVESERSTPLVWSLVANDDSPSSFLKRMSHQTRPMNARNSEQFWLYGANSWGISNQVQAHILSPFDNVLT